MMPPLRAEGRRDDAPPVDTYTRGDHHVALHIASDPGLLNQAKARTFSNSARPREARLAFWSKIMMEA